MVNKCKCYMREIYAKLGIREDVKVVVVSKSRGVSEISKLYDRGFRDFGENRVREFLEKRENLPDDIRWHFTGHLQSNKVKYLIGFVYMIQSVDSIKLLNEINKQAKRKGKKVNCLIQINISNEKGKYGFKSIDEVIEFLRKSDLECVRIKGVMGIAKRTGDKEVIRENFNFLRGESYKLLREVKDASIISCGMSSDYKIAISGGSNMLRLGRILFS